MSRPSPDSFAPGDPQRLRRRLRWIDAQRTAWLTLPGVAALCVAFVGGRDDWIWGLLAVLLIVPVLVLGSLSDSRRNAAAAPYLGAAAQSRAWWWGVWITGAASPQAEPPPLGGGGARAVVGRIAVRRWPMWVASVGCAVAMAWLGLMTVSDALVPVVTLGMWVSGLCGWVATVRLVEGPRPGRVVLEVDADEIWIDFRPLHFSDAQHAGRHGAFGLRWESVQRVTLSRISGGRLVLELATVTGGTYTADLTRVWLDIAALEACIETYARAPAVVETH